MKTEVPHLLVVIPGIGGTELHRDGQNIWAMSLPTMFKTLRTLGRSLSELAPDDPTALDDPEFDDGIRLGGLLEAPTSLPGLTRLPGYHRLRSTLDARFDLNELNYLEFGYDWRRDIRLSAAKLASEIDQRLALLDPYVGRAEVLIVAHSMGGLVARQWLDEHNGAERCRGLITLGTPFRGSPKAARMLSGGYVWRSLGSQRFADLLRSLPSVHQLLPIYPCVYVEENDEPVYVHALENPVRGIDASRAADARTLLLRLNESSRPTLTSVVGGENQTTLQSLAVSDGKLTFAHRGLPSGFGRSEQTSGDGTVPWISSRPLDYGTGSGLTPAFFNQSHGGLSQQSGVLDGVASKIDHLLVDNDPARSPFEGAPAISTSSDVRLTLDLAEEYLEGEPVTVRLSTANIADGTMISVTVGDVQHVVAVEDGKEWIEVDVGALPVGSHLTTATPSQPMKDAPTLSVVDHVDVWSAQ